MEGCQKAVLAALQTFRELPSIIHLIDLWLGWLFWRVMCTSENSTTRVAARMLNTTSKQQELLRYPGGDDLCTHPSGFTRKYLRSAVEPFGVFCKYF